MSDLDQDPQIRRLFTNLGEVVGQSIHPVSTETLRGVLRRRRRNRTIAAMVLALAVIVGPTTAYTLLSNQTGPANPQPASPSQSSSPSTVSSPSTIPPSSEPSASADLQVPDGRISMDVLGNSLLTIPIWPAGFSADCPFGDLQFSSGKVSSSSISLALVYDPAYADVDSDGAVETTVVVACAVQGTDYQVLTFDRDANNQIYLLGVVLKTAGSNGTSGTDVLKVWQIEAGNNGWIRVSVGDYRPCCSIPQDIPQRQWRTYGWNGSVFEQVDGQTSFPANPKVVDLRLSGSATPFTKQSDGLWQSTVTLTVTNLGPAGVYVALVASSNATTPTITGTNCSKSFNEILEDTCAVGVVNPSTPQKLTYTVTTTEAPTGKFLWFWARHTGGAGSSTIYPDQSEDNNKAVVTVTVG